MKKIMTLSTLIFAACSAIAANAYSADEKTGAAPAASSAASSPAAAPKPAQEPAKDTPSSDVVVLRVHHFLNSVSPTQRTVVSWCDKIAADSAGKLKCDIRTDMSLGGAPAQLMDQARAGEIADIVWSLPSYEVGRYVKTEALELPFLTLGAAKESLAAWEYVSANAADEYAGLKLLAAHMNDGGVIHLSSSAKIPKTLDDMQGLRLRSAGRMATKVLAAVGASSILMPPAFIKDFMERKALDGALMPYDLFLHTNLKEVSKVQVIAPEVDGGEHKLLNSAMVFVMNAKKYDSLPDNLKKVIDDNSGAALSMQFGKAYEEDGAKGVKLSKEGKNQIVVIPPNEYRRWMDVRRKVENEWTREAAAMGYPGPVLLTTVKKLMQAQQREPAVSQEK